MTVSRISRTDTDEWFVVGTRPGGLYLDASGSLGDLASARKFGNRTAAKEVAVFQQRCGRLAVMRVTQTVRVSYDSRGSERTPPR